MKKYLRNPVFLILIVFGVWFAYQYWHYKTGKPVSPLFLRLGFMEAFAKMNPPVPGGKPDPNLNYAT